MAKPILKLFHGGSNQFPMGDIPKGKSGRQENGPGVYLTTSLADGVKYAKGGGRVLHEVAVHVDHWASDTAIPMRQVERFLRSLPPRHRDGTYANDVHNTFQRAGWGKILDRLDPSLPHSEHLPAVALINLASAAENFTPGDYEKLRKFLVDSGIHGDYSETTGGGLPSRRDWVTVFTTDAIIVSRPIKPSGYDSTFQHDGVYEATLNDMLDNQRDLTVLQDRVDPFVRQHLGRRYSPMDFEARKERSTGLRELMAELRSKLGATEAQAVQRALQDEEWIKSGVHPIPQISRSDLTPALKDHQREVELSIQEFGGKAKQQFFALFHTAERLGFSIAATLDTEAEPPADAPERTFELFDSTGHRTGIAFTLDTDGSFTEATFQDDRFDTAAINANTQSMSDFVKGPLKAFARSQRADLQSLDRSPLAIHSWGVAGEPDMAGITAFDGQRMIGSLAFSEDRLAGLPVDDVLQGAKDLGGLMAIQRENLITGELVADIAADEGIVPRSVFIENLAHLGGTPAPTTNRIGEAQLAVPTDDGDAFVIGTVSSTQEAGRLAFILEVARSYSQASVEQLNGRGVYEVNPEHVQKMGVFERLIHRANEGTLPIKVAEHLGTLNRVSSLHDQKILAEVGPGNGSEPPAITLRVLNQGQTSKATQRMTIEEQPRLETIDLHGHKLQAIDATDTLHHRSAINDTIRQNLSERIDRFTPTLSSQADRIEVEGEEHDVGQLAKAIAMTRSQQLPDKAMQIYLNTAPLGKVLNAGGFENISEWCGETRVVGMVLDNRGIVPPEPGQSPDLWCVALAEERHHHWSDGWAYVGESPEEAENVRQALEHVYSSSLAAESKGVRAAVREQSRIGELFPSKPPMPKPGPKNDFNPSMK